MLSNSLNRMHKVSYLSNTGRGPEHTCHGPYEQYIGSEHSSIVSELISPAVSNSYSIESVGEARTALSAELCVT